MKRLEAEIRGKSLSERTAKVRIAVERGSEGRVEWFASSGESLWQSDDPASFPRLSFFSRRSTGLSSRSGASLSTVEHLSPVLLLYPQCRFEIRAASKELPILDGSAYPWYEAVRHLAGIPGDLPFYRTSLKTRIDWGYGFLEACPAETLEIECSISHGTFRDDAYAAIYDASDLVALFPARTFIFEDDWKKAAEAGLLAAADESCGLLLRAEEASAKPLAGGDFRMPSEPAKHKILDLIGDLSLPTSALPRLRIRIHNGGHVAHRKLIEKLLDDAFRDLPRTR